MKREERRLTRRQRVVLVTAIVFGLIIAAVWALTEAGWWY